PSAARGWLRRSAARARPGSRSRRKGPPGSAFPGTGSPAHSDVSGRTGVRRPGDAMDTQLTLTSVPVADGTSMDVVVAQPVDGGPWPGILYPFESYGLTDHMVDRARKTAAEGFVVALPDLYHRLGRLRVTRTGSSNYRITCRVGSTSRIRSRYER